MFLKCPHCLQPPHWPKRGKATGTLFCLHPSDTERGVALCGATCGGCHHTWDEGARQAREPVARTLLDNFEGPQLWCPNDTSQPLLSLKARVLGWHSLVTLPFTHLCFVEHSVNFLSGVSYFGERSTIFLKQPGGKTLFLH